MSDAAIRDYAFLSDCQTAALVGRDGSVDWYCPGRFDAPSAFGRLLDPSGGHWSIRPVERASVERAYLAGTLVLRTVFRTERGTVSLTDALALMPGARGHEIGEQSPRLLLRRVEGLEGEVELALECAPRMEYGLARPRVTLAQDGAVMSAGPLELRLQTRAPLVVADAAVNGRFTLRAGETLDFALAARPAFRRSDAELRAIDVAAELENTRAGWQSWTAEHQGYDGLYRDLVQHSSLVLQGLTYQPTGAIVAAATTSLPEQIGGADNWDYRFTWLRDLSMTMRALWVSACPTESERFFRWFAQALGNHPGTEEHIQIVFGVEGERDLTEHTLDHLRGFQGSAPARVGNDAWRQKQLDVPGEVLDALFLFHDTLGQLGEEIADLVVTMADQAAARWREPDAGMWEARDKQRHYLSSKVLCWVALDRAVQLAPRIGKQSQSANWAQARDAVRQEILERGWSDEAGAYTGAFGSNQLDASVLLMPLVGFLPATDERMRATISTIARELAPDGLVHRWDGDANGFFLCTYWLVECLARAGEWQRARELFERTTAYANDVGLLSEMGDAAGGVLIGNYPQAFSHVGLINAAWTLTETQPNRPAPSR